MSLRHLFDERPANSEVEQAYRIQWREVCAQHERSVVFVLYLQWLVSIAFATWLSPFSEKETGRVIHEHVWLALFMGGSLAIVPDYLTRVARGEFLTRAILGIAQVLYSSLFIHLLFGRIEAHFHIFGSLAFLSFFRDWRVLAIASGVVLLDHVVRGLFWPEMIYGTGIRGLVRTLEHGLWVVFVDIFLILASHRSHQEMREITRKNVELQQAKLEVDHRVYERTIELQREKEKVDRLALVAQLTTNAVVVLDNDLRVTWANAGVTRIYGVAAKLLIGSDIRGWIQLDEMAGVGEEMAGSLSTGMRREVQTTIGSVKRWLDTEIQPVHSPEGERIGFIVIQNDVTERCALRERLSSVFAAMAEGIIVYDSTGRIVECNPQAQRIFGIQRNEQGEAVLTRVTIFEDGSLWPPTDHPAMVSLRSGIPIHDAIMGVRDGQGTTCWISVNTQLIGDSTAESHVVASFTDVTLRREQLERMDLTIRGAGLGVWDWNAATHHVRFNQIFARMLGYRPEQLRPNREQWEELIHPDDLLESKRVLAAHTSGQRPDFRCEYRMRNASGEWHWILAAGRVVERDSEQNPLRIAGVHVDINKSKKLETKLRDSEAKLRQIFDLALDGVVATDQMGHILDWNQQAERIFGFSRQDAIGRRLDHLLQVESDVEKDWLVSLGFPSDGVSEGKRQLVSALARDGRTLAIEMAISAIHDEDQTTYALFIRDLTHSKRMEQQLMQAQRLESLGQLAAGVAHEINTPVQFVNDSVHFLRDGVQDLFSTLDQISEAIESIQDSESRELMGKKLEAARAQNDVAYLVENIPEAIDRSIDGLGRVSEIVRSMKELSHRGSREFKPNDLTRAITNALTIAQNEYKYFADVHTDIEDLPLVTCNIGEINQVLLNLVINASHAIADRVRGTAERGCITVRARVDGDSVYLSITDTGTGIPKRIQHRIFEPFFTTKEVGKGTGQGLALAHSMIQSHHGELSFETRPNVGTTFYIRLPIEFDPTPVENQS